MEIHFVIDKCSDAAVAAAAIIIMTKRLVAVAAAATGQATLPTKSFNEP